ncbi:hypothetical protein M2271_005423 [Streptomyces sp. LBL]|nr:hypothetical protein [Streptomyces sp. LBL]
MRGAAGDGEAVADEDGLGLTADEGRRGLTPDGDGDEDRDRHQLT